VLDLDQLRLRLEQCNQDVAREYYVHGAGLKKELAAAPILESYADAFSPETVAQVRAAWQAAEGEEKVRLRFLYQDVTQNFLGRKTAPLQDQIGSEESSRTVNFEGEEIPLPAASVRVANEPDMKRRRRLDDARLRAIAELNPLYARSHAQAWQTIAELLDPAGYIHFYSTVKSIDFNRMAETLRAFLKDTRELYMREMDSWSREGLGIPLKEARRCDVAVLMRLREFDQSFPSSRMVPLLEVTLQALGIDLKQQDNAHLDLEPRPLKRPRAFCSPIRVPEEVYLVVLPKGGYDDYRALFHEAGHLEHFASTKPDLAYEYRWVGDNSITEGYAFNLEHLLIEDAWLGRHVSLPADDRKRLVRKNHLILLFMLRRYASKLLYELELHRSPEVGPELAQRYADQFGDALGFIYEPEEYLVDVDSGFYCAEYLRAWFFDGRLTAWLRREHGHEWWMEERAGVALRSLWADGQRYPADVLAARLDGDGALDPAPLVKRIRAALEA
jgi:hypothetical protein